MQIPAGVIKKVAEWADLHNAKLMENWERLKNGEEAESIEPFK